MTEKENLIYLAGIIDGEGCFWRGFHTNGRGDRHHRSHIVVGNSSKELVDWLKDHYGGYLFLTLRKHKNPNWTDLWRWSITGKKAEELARKLLPYLIVKKEQVKRILPEEVDHYLITPPRQQFKT